MIHPYCLLLHGVAVMNSWILYKKHCSQNGITQRSNLLALLDFQARIADSLLHKKKTVIRGRPRTDSPVMMKHKQSANNAGAATEIPLDNVGHLPV